MKKTLSIFAICTFFITLIAQHATNNLQLPVEDHESISENHISDAQQKDITLVRETLMDYIEGTANGNAERIKKAFHKDLNLYTVDQDQLKIRSGQKYITYFEDGKKRNRIGKIVSIDLENNAAIAKVNILMPEMKRNYTDYMMLLKIEGQWKIIHKSYTYTDMED